MGGLKKAAETRSSRGLSLERTRHTMISLRWVSSVLLGPFLREQSLDLIRPRQIEWAPALSPRTAKLKRYTLFYGEAGTGSPLLLIHGYGAGLWVWEKQIEVLSQHHRVLALDLVGHGFSDRPRISYTPDAYVDCVRDFMDRLGLEKAVLIGNSMGGGIAWAMAVLFPERVDKLILIDSVPPDVLGAVRNESFRTLIAMNRVPFLAQWIIASRSRRSLRQVLRECLSDRTLIREAILRRQYDLLRIKGTTWVLYSTLAHAEEGLKFRDRLREIVCPTLLIWGEEDQVLPCSVGEALHEMIPGSVLRVIPKSGHIPMWESPEKVNPLLLSFLARDFLDKAFADEGK
jgi:pimeloyl-ACP methyl ester carboxylesterase